MKRLLVYRGGIYIMERGGVADFRLASLFEMSCLYLLT